ncbi:MAG: phosphopeptide-binding protein, partial [Bacteroidetes bacterium QH_2_63_10]
PSDEAEPEADTDAANEPVEGEADTDSAEASDASDDEEAPKDE